MVIPDFVSFVNLISTGGQIIPTKLTVPQIFRRSNGPVARKKQQQKSWKKEKARPSFGQLQSRSNFEFICLTVWWIDLFFFLRQWAIQLPACPPGSFTGRPVDLPALLKQTEEEYCLVLPPHISISAQERRSSSKVHYVRRLDHQRYGYGLAIGWPLKWTLSTFGLHKQGLDCQYRYLNPP